MIFGPMKEMEMAEYLHGMELLNQKLMKRKQEVYQEVETLEECIERNTFPGATKEVVVYTGTDKDKVFTILQRSYQDIEKQLDDISRELIQIMEEEEKMAHVKSCIRGLPFAQAELINELFVRGCSWEAYARSNYIGRTTLARRRKRAMGNLLVLYNLRFAQKGDKK